MKAINVHSYESMGTFDGPGLRYVIFLQGCPFRCLYCANPDTIDMVGESHATSPQYILEQAKSMKPFFGKRGGVTFSGGEPLLQSAFLEGLIPLLKTPTPLQLAIETSGFAAPDAYRRVVSQIDLVFQDLKHPDPVEHKRWTGVDPAPIHANLRWLKDSGRPFIARIPLIPGVNDTPEAKEGFARLLEGPSGLLRVELLPYHRLGVHKYEAMGLEYKLPDVKENTPEQLARAEGILREYFPQLVVN